MEAEDIKGVLVKLVALQKIDTEYFEYRQGLKDKPAELEVLKEKYESKKEEFHRLETEIKQADLHRKKIEADLKEKEEQIVKANASLMSLKTNKEYQAKLFEIENMKADQSMLEEQILQSMEKIERLQKDVEKEKEFLLQEESQYLAEKEKIDLEIAELQKKADGLAGARQEAASGVDAKTLDMYERILENRGGVAIVPVVGMSCGGCFMNLNMQMINCIKMYHEIVRCERCARIIYLPDDWA